MLSRISDTSDLLSDATTRRSETLVELLRARALQQPDRVAYTFLLDGEAEELHLTYSELDRRARSVAAWLQSFKATGEHVLLLYPPGLEYIVAFFGCVYAGAVAVPAYPPRLNRSLGRLQSIVADAQATVALTTTTILSKIQPLLAEAPYLEHLRWLATDGLDNSLAGQWQEPGISGRTLAFLQYTSGSTAAPKGVMVSHANLLHNEEMIRHAFGQTSASVIVGWLPLYHDMGLIGNVLQPLRLGAACVLFSPSLFLQRPVRWLAAISKYRATTSGGPNFAYDLCSGRITAEQRATLDLSSWSVAFNGAEPVREETLDRFARTFESCGFRREAFHPCYGLAEATLIVSGGLKSGRQTIKTVQTRALDNHLVIETPADETNTRRLVGCGEVLPDQKVFIVQPQALTLCAPDEVGEIWVKGPSVTGGYWNRPEETERTFGAYLAETVEGPFLRTGDLGFLKDGELFVTGRLKDLIIIRGRNHYPHDIELTVERSHPALRPGCGAAFAAEVDGQERLVIVQELDHRQPAAAETVMQSIRQAVSEEHEIQVDAIVLVKAGTILKTSSGKIQRHACRAAFLESNLEGLAEWRASITSADESLLSTRPMTPQSAGEVEAWLLLHMAARLNVNPAEIEVNQPITRYGLDSLIAIELMHSIESNLGVTLPMVNLLQSSSIAELATQVFAQLTAESAAPRSRITPSPEPKAEHALSHGQKALWFLHQLAPESAAYNLAFSANIRGALNTNSLRRALQALVARHASLRTTFISVQGEPLQRVQEHAEICFEEEDASAWSETALHERLSAEAHRPFDLEKGPVLRVMLLRRSAQEHILLLAVHHIAVDFWSLAIIVHELGALYEAEQLSAPLTLSTPPLQYTDYARWQSEMLGGLEGNRLWAYWQKQLGGELPSLNLLTDYPRPQVQTYNGASEPFHLSEELTRSLKEFSHARGATLYMTLMAAFQVLLARHTGQEEILVGSPTTDRNWSDLAGVVGYFVNPVVLRGKPSGDLTFEDFLRQVRGTVLSAFEHQDYPFALLVERLQPEHDASRSPLFQAMFILHKAHLLDQEGLASFALGETGAHIKLGDLLLESISLEKRVAQFSLTLMMAEVDGVLVGSMQYNTDLFDAATISRMNGHFQMLLQAIVAHPEHTLASLPLLTEAEQHQLLTEWNETASDYSADQSIHHLFEAQVQRTPDALALVHEDERLSYVELNRRANQLARHLRALGIGPEMRVGVLMERSAEMVAVLLGVLKAGGAYVPLDPAYPQERIAFMLEDAQVAVLLTERKGRETLPEHGTRVVCLDTEWHTLAGLDDENLTPNVAPGNLAYLIYTSGSTGRPKGVAIEHRNVLAFLDWAKKIFTEEDLSGVLASTSICFDLSIFELFVTLCSGGRVVLVDNALHLATLTASNEVTLINTVPSAMTELLRAGALPASVRTVNLAGEPLQARLVQQIYEQETVQRVFNLYGPSEDTTYSTFALMNGSKPPTIGRPISNTQIYLLDQHLQPVPLGVPAQLFIAGHGLARGYLNRPHLTAQKFIPHPFSQTPGARLYQTGDLARFLPDGTIEFLGRLDHQVKIRGFRIELGEVESALLQHEGVREALVMAREDVPGEKRLVAYLVLAEGAEPGISALRRHLQERLPEYMIPGAFVKLEEMPLSPNGKVARGALPAPERERMAVEQAYVGARTAVEEMLGGIWGEVLGVERVGIEDNFFELGGHSLLGTQIVSRVRELFHVELPLRDLFTMPTISALSERIEEAIAVGQSLHQPAIKPVPRDGASGLSFAQQRLWFLDQLEPGNSIYNLSAAVRLTGQLNPCALQKSLNEIIRRHESLRTTFIVTDTEPMQVIAPELALALPIIDLCEIAEAEREAKVTHLALEEARRSFDLTRGPLLRASLLRLHHAQHVLLFTMHHIISDGWSMGLLVREVAALYSAFSLEKPAPLPELPIQYADFAHWQHQWLQGPRLEDQLAYWKEQLRGPLPVLALPTDRVRPAVQSFRGARRSIQIGAEMSQGLKGLSQRLGATLFMTMLGAFQTLLMRYSGQEEIVVGTPIANRTRGEVEGLIGFFVNTLVLRVEVSGGASFTELVERVKEVSLGAYAHQELPFEKLVEELEPERSLSHTPLFQVMFSMQNAPAQTLQLPHLTVKTLEMETGTAKFDLVLDIQETEQGLIAALEYNTDLFDAGTIERMLGHFRNLLQGIVVNPEQRLLDLPLLADEERQQLLARWNDTRSAYPKNLCVQQLFAAQAARSPDAIAITCGAEQLTYRELNERANQLAHYLRGLGVGPEALVGVLLERSIEMVVALLGVLKAGGAYVPLDPTYPSARLSRMLADAGVKVLLTERAETEKPGNHNAHVVHPGEAQAAIARRSKENPVLNSTAENLAYVIYTSGTTGQPKGVEIQHSGLVNLINWHQRIYQITAADRATQLAGLEFDAAVWELWPHLTAGASIHLPDEETRASVSHLAEWLAEEALTVCFLPTPLAELILEEPGLDGSALRLLLTGGDKLHRRPNPAMPFLFVNHYGPTENTVVTTSAHVSAGATASAAAPPIGRPIANAEVYLLDSNFQPVPVGVSGELYIGGDSLARGYRRHPELTAEKFIPHPFSAEPGARLYRSGDLARYLPDGQLEFLGRVDQQVKIRGFRIELGEIETALSEHAAVRECIVMAREDAPGHKQLVAYVVASASANPSTDELRGFLRGRLPAYMIPAAFVMRAEMPLTPNGKVDRRALPAPEQVCTELAAAYVAPRNPIEEKLAAMWAGVIGVERVGIHDNFFELGGHSLLATRIISAARKAFEVEIPVRNIFETPTVASFAQAIEQSRRGKQGAEVSIIKAQPRDRKNTDQLLATLEQLSEEDVKKLLQEKKLRQKRGIRHG
jgi:amino acid adenylation domain-containing protein